MYRFLSWMAIGIAAAFLVVATAAFSLPATKWLAFAIGLGTLAASAGVSYRYRRHIATLVTATTTALVSLWTVVASLVFSEPTVQNLALASGLALGALAIAGISEHEFAMERAIAHSYPESGERKSGLAAAA
jgi:hypothetical protein